MHAHYVFSLHKNFLISHDNIRARLFHTHWCLDPFTDNDEHDDVQLTSSIPDLPVLKEVVY